MNDEFFFFFFSTYSRVGKISVDWGPKIVKFWSRQSDVKLWNHDFTSYAYCIFEIHKHLCKLIQGSPQLAITPIFQINWTKAQGEQLTCQLNNSYT